MLVVVLQHICVLMVGVSGDFMHTHLRMMKNEENAGQ
jgi:hypothetical protein